MNEPKVDIDDATLSQQEKAIEATATAAVDADITEIERETARVNSSKK